MLLNKKEIILQPSQAQVFYKRGESNICDFVISKNMKKIYVVYYPITIVGWNLKNQIEIGQIRVILNEISQIQERKNKIAVSSIKSSTILIYDFLEKELIIELRHQGVFIQCFQFNNYNKNNKYKDDQQKNLFYSLDFQDQLYIWKLNKCELLHKIKFDKTLEKILIPQQLRSQSLIQYLQKVKNYPFSPILQNQSKSEGKKVINQTNCLQISLQKSKILKFCILSQKLIRCNKSLKFIHSLTLLNDNKWIIVNLYSRNILIFDVSTFKFVTSIMNYYEFQKITILKKGEQITILAFDLFGLKVWRFIK